MTETDQDPLCLENQLCFAVYTLSRVMTQNYRPLLADMQLTYPQYLVLLVLWHRDNVSLKAISEKLMLDCGTLTPIMKRLQDRGYVTKSRPPGNEREIRIALTESGRALKEQAKTMSEHMLLAGKMEEDQANQLRSQLMKLLYQFRTPSPDKKI